MPPSPLFDLIESAADPFLILSGSGCVLWKNAAYSRLADRCDPPGPLSTATIQRILKADHFEVIPISLRSHGKEEQQTAVAIDLSPGDPDSAAVLVALKPTFSDESRLNAREELLATVAHDLRNPIGAVFSYADALLDTEAGEELKPSHREILRRIRSTAARAVQMVLNYQILAQFKRKGLLKPSALVDLNQLVHTVIDSSWRDESQGVTLIADYSPDKPALAVDRIHIERIVSNLLHNALKYTPAGGKVTIKTELSAAMVSISVSNSGARISDEEVPTLFERYHRASSSQGKSGTGLGLYIVKMLAEANGGNVKVRSDDIAGVCFTVTFPLSL